MISVRFHAQSDPSDLPLVLLPPFPFDHRAWQGVATELGGDVITVDPPGFGGECDGAPGLEAYAAALLVALGERGVGRFVVAGNSMGGYAAMALAEVDPSRIAGIGLFGTKSTADADEARAGRLAMADRADAGAPAAELLADMKPKLVGDTTRQTRAEVVAAVDQLADAAPAAGIAWAQRSMAQRPDRTAALQALRGIPAEVVRGSEDPLMDAESQQVMSRALGLMGVTEVGGVGHLLPLEAPVFCVRVLEDLWNRSRG